MFGKRELRLFCEQNNDKKQILHALDHIFALRFLLVTANTRHVFGLRNTSTTMGLLEVLEVSLPVQSPHCRQSISKRFPRWCLVPCREEGEFR